MGFKSKMTLSSSVGAHNSLYNRAQTRCPISVVIIISMFEIGTWHAAAQAVPPSLKA